MTYYRINSPNVIHDIIDDEAVIVNLEVGSYYSIENTGAMIWQSLSNGLSDGEIAQAISENYEVAPQESKRVVDQFIGELQNENLIVVNEAQPVGQSSSSLLRATPAQEGQSIFEGPVLQKYTDMEDLLLLDPIHDVDEAGWPNSADRVE